MNKNKELLPYYEKAKESLIYNSETGVFLKFKKTIGEHREVGRVSGTGYLQIGITIEGVRRHLASHRLAWFMHYGAIPVDTVDHINNDRLDNRIINLRLASMTQQNHNRSKQVNKNGYRGIYKSGNGWVARIREDGVFNYLGIFKDPKEASLAYEKRAKEFQGDFYNAT